MGSLFKFSLIEFCIFNDLEDVYVWKEIEK